jgi:hypothetical protein
LGGDGVAAARSGANVWRRLRACALLAALALLAGCIPFAEQVPGELAVRSAQLRDTAGGAMLDLALDCRLSGPMQDALEHGIPLTLRIDLDAGRRLTRTHRQERQHVELRYFPLSRRYQLREAGSDDVRSFATPASLLAALGTLHLPLPDGFARLPAATPLRVSAALDPAALPGALRLPALFEPAWRLAAEEHAWTVAAH